MPWVKRKCRAADEEYAPVCLVCGETVESEGQTCRAFIEQYGIVDGVATRWITRQGEQIFISSMSQGHLTNVLALLDRKAHEFGPVVTKACAQGLAKHLGKVGPYPTVWERLLAE